MKPPTFEYHRPDSVEEALAVLDRVGADGKVLAGGQSLVPVLNMRLAAPAHLVDVNRLRELAYLRSDGLATRIGALARHAEVERQAAGLVKQATGHIAHPAIRNRGTAVGSLVHADPAAELPAVLAALGGTVTLASLNGRREVAWDEFFVGPLESSLRPGELAVEASFPHPPPRSGTAWLEVSRRRGDYALCGVGVAVTLDADRRVSGAVAGYVSVGPTPVRVDLTSTVAGQQHDAVDWSAAAALARESVAPEDDIHASAGYRRHLVGVLTGRAGSAAIEELKGREWK
jgi:carbon-monoxide dehydrogenase medium subunit